MQAYAYKIKKNLPFCDDNAHRDSHRLSNKTPTLDRSLPLSCCSELSNGL